MSTELIPIEIKNQSGLLNKLASGYNTLSRTLMEYIDNSFDSADDFFDEESQTYTRSFSIDINIDKHKNRISITDNCVGMSKEALTRLASEIHDSQKLKNQKKGSWVNGQFGLGAHAFRLFSANMAVTSKQSGGEQWSIYIDRSKDNAEIYQHPHEIIDDSGTVVELGDIDKQQMKNMSMSELKNDIENHFEMLLRRNVSIRISDGINEVKCEPFNYDDVEGIPIKASINSWQVNGATTNVSGDKGVEVHLKVTKTPLNRSVYFSGKGRKISGVLDLPSFKNYVNNYGKKRNVWSNPLLTGYIEVGSNLQPRVTRDDFEPQIGKRTAIYDEISKLEDEIFEAIQKEMQNKQDEGMKTLGSALTDILSKLAKEDTLNLRKLDESNQKNPEFDNTPVQFDPNDEGGSLFNTEGGIIVDPNPNPPVPDPQPLTEETRGNPDPNGEKTGTPAKPQKQGMQIEFMSVGDSERAMYGDGVIYIFTEHPDFKNRVGRTRGGELGSAKVTPRLANYLSAVISSKYKEQFYQQKKLEPERDKVLEEQIEFIFRFENLMQSFIDQSLDKIGEITQ